MRFVLLAILLASCGPAFTQSPQEGDVYVWENDDPDFGGLSGLEMVENGGALTAISDRGYMFTALVTRDNGRIAALSQIKKRITPHASDRPKYYDTEGLAVADDGRMYISVEREHQVFAISPDTQRATALPQHPDFPALQWNSSLEALAIDRNGNLYAMPERSGRKDRPFPVYKFNGQMWTVPFTIPRRGAFLVVGADVGPDDRLYVLERHFSGFGFSSRVRRFALDGTAEETLLTTPNGTHDNLEAISIWQDGDTLIMTLLSDDNFRFFQQTQLVEYPVPN